MPHISKTKLEGRLEHELESHILSLLSESSPRTRRLVIGELITKTEKIMIGKRLMLVLLVKKGFPTHKIADLLKMSPSTVARFELNHSNGKFNFTSSWLRNTALAQRIFKPLLELLAVPFDTRQKSLERIMKE